MRMYLSTTLTAYVGLPMVSDMTIARYLFETTEIIDSSATLVICAKKYATPNNGILFIIKCMYWRVSVDSLLIYSER